MSAEHQQFHLWPEELPINGPESPVHASAEHNPLPLPFVPSRLPLNLEAPITPEPINANGKPGVIAEPFFNQRRQLRLMVTFPAGVAPFVNGEQCLHRVVLRAGDVFQWSTGPTFHVTVFSKPRIGPPSEDQLGKPCPVCRVPFTKDTVCFTCPCGSALHCEVDEVNGLQCARLSSECPRCKQPIIMTEGYSHIPNHD